jgi:dolichol-phosphate mannosyltransferase
MLSVSALVLFAISLILIVAEAVLKLLAPSLTPRGITTVLLSILFFGSLNLLAIGVVGEYLAKIFEEVKQRPHFIRRSVIRDGEIRLTAQEQKRRQ